METRRFEPNWGLKSVKNWSDLPAPPEEVLHSPPSGRANGKSQAPVFDTNIRLLKKIVIWLFFESVSRLVTLSSVVLVGSSLELQSTTASTAGELSPTISRVEHL